MTPDLQQLHAAARRERALAMNRLIFAPIAAFFRRPKREPIGVAPCHS
jgi:hypothetical protein